MHEAVDTRWELHVTWRDGQGREWASGPMRYATTEEVRRAHTELVLSHRHGHSDRSHVLVHQPAKFERATGEGRWAPAGWDALTGTVEIRWPDEGGPAKQREDAA